MTTRKRQKRQEATHEEYSAGLILRKEQDALATTADQDLFVVDRGGSKTAKRKIEKESQQAVTGTASRTERVLVRKAVNRSKEARVAETGPAVGDIWGEVGTGKVAKPAKKGAAAVVEKKRKRMVVRPGQSYNPAPADHQDLLAEALALELEKKERDARSAGKAELLTLPAPSEADLARFAESDSEDEDSGDEGEDGDAPLGSRRSRRKGSKLTIAQRNKIRTRKAKSFEELKQKQESDLLKGIDNSAKLLKQMDQEEARVERRKQLQELQRVVQDEARLNYDEAKAVPLSDELRGSLRMITAKGLSIGDKVKEMRNNGDLTKRDRKRKHFENPHGSEKVVWVPKYKY